MICLIRSRTGVTILELMIAVMMTGLVFAVSMSLYSSGFRMITPIIGARDPADNPVILLEDIAKRISLCNDASVDASGVLHLRCDYAPGTYNALNSPANFLDDGRWHYRFAGGSLCMVSDLLPATVPPANAIVIPGIDAANSSFMVTAPSGGAGSLPIKVDIVLTTSTQPISQLRTSALVGAKASR